MIASDLLKPLSGVRHGFFNRIGGVSSGIYESLNCGLGSGDDIDKVRENRLRVANKLETEQDSPLTVRQIHSNRAISVDNVWTLDQNPEADGIVTATRGLAIGVLTADCAPILFCDAEAGVIGVAHAGWRGAKTGIIESVLDAMKGLGAKRHQIYVAIGPTLSQKAYEVGAEFVAEFLHDDEKNQKFFVKSGKNDKAHFDLPDFCMHRLLEANIAKTDSLGLCTYENESLFFSYRRSVHRGEVDYGRQISAILLM